MAKVIELVFETDENGALHIPAKLLGEARPRTRLRLRLEAEPAENAQPVQEASWRLRWAKMTPEERAKDFEAWARSHTDGPGLSDWAVSRDSIYD